MHTEPSKLKNQTIIVKEQDNLPGGEFKVEDWWDRVSGKSWAHSSNNTAANNTAAINYALRVNRLKLPIDDEVLYGKIGHLGYLVHMSEIEVKK